MRTSAGEISDSQKPMDRERIRSVGISLLGGNSNTPGPYELWVDSVQAVNEEQVPHLQGPSTKSLHIAKIPLMTITDAKTEDADWERGVL